MTSKRERVPGFTMPISDEMSFVVQTLQIKILELFQDSNVPAYVIVSTLLDLLSTVAVETVKEAFVEEFTAGLLAELEHAMADKFAIKRDSKILDVRNKTNGDHSE
jgi:hypothetical protein